MKGKLPTAGQLSNALMMELSAQQRETVIMKPPVPQKLNVKIGFALPEK